MAKMPKHLPVKEQTRGTLHGILERRGIVRKLQVLSALHGALETSWTLQ